MFNIYPEKCYVEMNQKVNKQIISRKIKSLKMTQFPVNSNIATIGINYKAKQNNM